jgi:hypothetical protein
MNDRLIRQRGFFLWHGADVHAWQKRLPGNRSFLADEPKKAANEPEELLAIGMDDGR